MKKAFVILTALMMACLLSAEVMAESATPDSWNIRYAQNGTFSEDFGASNEERTINALNHALDDEIHSMQPGNDVTFTVNLKNENTSSTDWYMTNEVLTTLENTAKTAAAGAYTYQLEYNGPGGQLILFESGRVGAKDSLSKRTGLKAATEELEQEYVYLDSLKSGQSGVVTLYVGLEGESQGNDYQNTLADLKLNFAVEQEASSSGRTSGRAVKTGDETSLNLWLILLGVGGAAVLAIALLRLRLRRKEDEQ